MRYRFIFLILLVTPFVTFIVVTLGIGYILLSIIETLLKPFFKPKPEPKKVAFLSSVFNNFIQNENFNKRPKHINETK